MTTRELRTPRAVRTASATPVQRLWAPWRQPFVQALRRQRGCFFCRAVRSRDERSHWVLRRTRHAIALLNIYPYTPGHLMIAPCRHTAQLGRLRPGEQRAIWRLLARMEGVLRHALHPDGFNVGMNIGRAAGAGVPGHLHLHLVPRWAGDVNFMPVLAGTKVMPQSLEACYEQLRVADARSA